MSVLISVAMKEEARLLFQALTGHKRIALSECERLKHRGRWCYLLTTGVGKVNAAVKVSQYLHRYKTIDYVINPGFAAATKDLHLGEVYQPDILTQWDFNVSDSIADRKRIILRSPQKIHLTTGDSFVTKGNLPFVKLMQPTANLFDMEAFAIAVACQDHYVDYEFLKVVSDYPEDNDDSSLFEEFVDDARHELFSKVSDLISTY